MVRRNGRAEAEAELDPERELPAPDSAEESVSPEAESELQKLKAERDSLVDRVARLQAEFENAVSGVCENSRTTGITPWPMLCGRCSRWSIASSERCM